MFSQNTNDSLNYSDLNQSTQMEDMFSQHQQQQLTISSQQQQGFSQQQRSQHNFNRPHATAAAADIIEQTNTSDYWSQSSSQQDEVLRGYSNRPLLFATRRKQTNPSSSQDRSYNRFYDVHQKKISTNHQRDVLDTFVKLLKESSTELKNTLDVVHSEVACEIKNSSESVKASLESSEQSLAKLQEELNQSIQASFKVAIDNQQLQDQLVQKENALESKDNEVKRLQEEISNLRSQIDTFSKCEETYFSAQMQKLDALLNQTSATSERVVKLEAREAKRVKDLTNENSNLPQMLEPITNLQNASAADIQLIKGKLNGQQQHHHSSEPQQIMSYNLNQQKEVLPFIPAIPSGNNQQNIANTQQQNISNIQQNRPHAMNNLQQNASQLPVNMQHNLAQQHSQQHNLQHHNVAQSQPLYHYNNFTNSYATQQNKNLEYMRPFSPLPFKARGLLNASTPNKASPTAVVAPMINQQVKEEKPLQQCPALKETKEKYHHDLFEVSSDSDSGQDLSTLLLNTKRKKKSPKKQTNMQKTNTPPAKKNEKEKNSTPVQRSIRRYGKIKKSVNPFSPVAIELKKQQSSRVELKDITNTSHNRTSPSSAIIKKTSFSRGSLALKRKQQSVFNFKDDEELVQLADLIKSTVR